jgi:hypothetical protein
MNTNIDRELVEALQSSGMLIRLGTSSLGVQVTDKARSRAITDGAAASRDAARVVVNRLPGAARAHHAKLTACQGAARTALHEMTTPWDESGWRFLPTVRFDDLMRRLSRIKVDFDAELAELRANASEVVRLARIELGELADNVHLPTAEEMVAAYDMATEVIPVPDGATFRGLPDSARATLAARLDNQLVKAYERGVDSIMDRVRPMLETMVERLVAFDKRENAKINNVQVGRVGVFRDSLVENVQPMADLVKSIASIKNDKRLFDLHAKLEEITNYTAKDLRDNAYARDSVKQMAGEALSMFDEWGLAA